jgi:hypothetical protein
MILELPPHIERRLTREATEHGMKPAEYLASLLDKQLKPDETPLQREPRRPGSAKGLVTVPPDFDEPLEDFAEYMP